MKKQYIECVILKNCNTFNIIAFIFFIVFLLSSNIDTQVDTIQLKLVVSKIHTQEDHNKFWQDLYDRDQSFRGDKTSTINDLENIISATYYLNRFGYPSEDIKPSSILPYVWIHASYPKVYQVTFPIILAGYKSHQISEKAIRTYYLRNKHWRKYFNEENRTKELSVLFADLDLNVEENIDVQDILTAYNESEVFLKQNFEVIGHWRSNKRNTTYKILKSEDGEYYFDEIYIDGSYYPEKVIQDEKYPNLFRNFYKPEFYYGIQPNGDLTMKNFFEKRTFRRIEE